MVVTFEFLMRINPYVLRGISNIKALIAIGVDRLSSKSERGTCGSPEGVMAGTSRDEPGHDEGSVQPGPSNEPPTASAIRAKNSPTEKIHR
jgi:hypothetical protein